MLKGSWDLRGCWRSGLVVLMLSQPASGAPEPESGPKMRPPHFVVFLADDLGWNDVGYHGGEIETPNIDELARTGMRLNRFYVEPHCTPTRAAFLTGRYPIRYGLQRGVCRPWSQFGLAAKERTLAEALKEAGYFTAILGKWHLGHTKSEYLPTRQGFDYQYGHDVGSLHSIKHTFLKVPEWNRNDRPVDEKGYVTDLIGDEAVTLIERHDPDKPLFLFLPFNTPHVPFVGPERWLDRDGDLKPASRQHYFAMVRTMDETIGRVLVALEAKGLRERTLVVFTSDNGTGVQSTGIGSNAPLRGDKNGLYEGGIRVPTILYWPGVLPPGSVNENLFHIVDLLPTLVTLAGGSLEQELPLDGIDIWPQVVRSEKTPERELLLNVNSKQGALRLGDWKLLVCFSSDGFIRRTSLFNVADDPEEKRDLARKQPGQAADLLKRLLEYERQTEPELHEPREPIGYVYPKRWGPVD